MESGNRVLYTHTQNERKRERESVKQNGKGNLKVPDKTLSAQTRK
jgi:hypothetical protein